MTEAEEKFIARVDARDEFALDVDGFWYYWPKRNGGSISTWMLRAIADELDRRNEPWQREIDAYFAEPQITTEFINDRR
jgi:hypothetical protein